jgi:copper chaperone
LLGKQLRSGIEAGTGSAASTIPAKNPLGCGTRKTSRTKAYDTPLSYAEPEPFAMSHLVLTISGMSCGHCLNSVNRALAELPGVVVTGVRIGRAEVDYEPEQIGPERIIAAVAAQGYPAVVVPGG